MRVALLMPARLRNMTLSSRVIAVLAFALILLWSSFIWLTVTERAERVERAELTLIGLASAYGEHAATVMRYERNHELEAKRLQDELIAFSSALNVAGVTLSLREMNAEALAGYKAYLKAVPDLAPEHRVENGTISVDVDRPEFDIVATASMDEAMAIQEWYERSAIEFGGLLAMTIIIAMSARALLRHLEQRDVMAGELRSAMERAEERSRALKDEVVTREALEGKLRQAEKMEAVGTLAAGVAHELNNLLQPIIMMTELVLVDLPEESTHAVHLGRVVDAGGKAAEIVQRILAFGRADEVPHASLNISSVTRESISFIRTILPSSITLHVDVDDSVGMIHGDKTQLTQVLLNLVTNARDAIGENVGTVWVGLSTSSLTNEALSSMVGSLKAGTYAILTVRDSGAGMDKVTMQRMFDPFYTTKGVGKGTGLGLSVTQGIIADHGGGIKVDSALGQGTTFSVYLPVEKIDVAVALAA